MANTTHTDTPVYEIRYCDDAPAVDGWLDAPCWQRARWIDRFVAMDTWKPAKPAAAALLWDPTALYLGLRITEPQLGMLRAEGEPIGFDDLVEFYLDAGLPGIEYLVVSVNARGCVAVHKRVIEDPGWGTLHPFAVDGIRSAARLTGRGWQIELAFPFSASGLPAPASGQRWRGNVCRTDRLACSWSFWALEEPVRYSYADHKLFPELRFDARIASQPKAATPPVKVKWPARPRFDLRGFMYDTSRGSLVYRPDYWRERFPFFKEMGINTILMYFENHLRYASHGAFAPEGAWTVGDLVAVQEAGAACGIDVIPAQTSLGHCTGILNHPDYREFAEAGSNGYQFCVAHPGSRRVLTGMFDELAAASRSPFVSINADESAYLGLCPRCRAAFPGWSKGRIFMHHILPIYEVIRAHGKRMMMWDDMPWLFPDAIEVLPRDVILLDWHYGPHRRYPSLERWRSLGFDVVVCPAMYRVENAFWFADHGVKQGAMGLINTLWEEPAMPLGSRWHHFAATSWAAHAAAPREVDGWYARAGKRFFGAAGERLGRSLAAQDNAGRNGYRVKGTPPSALEAMAACQAREEAERLLATDPCAGNAHEWLEEFVYARRLQALEARAAQAAAQGRSDTAERTALREESARLRQEGLARWQRQCCVPSQQAAFVARYDKINRDLNC